MKNILRLTLLTILICCIACNERQYKKQLAEHPETISIDNNEVNLIHPKDIKIDSSKYAYGFDFPVGKPDGKGYYNAQKFGKNNHLGDDWNGNNGGNSDLGDPIFAIGRGYIKFAQNIGGGWGNVIRIVHFLPNEKKYESIYAHCDSILVAEEKLIEKGDQIGTIGTANGQYYAHLHLEIRDNIDLEIGGGYSENQDGYVDPTAFIDSHRKIQKQE